MFLDTSVIVAYYNSRDGLHKRAFELLPKIVRGDNGRVFISDYIFDEAVTVSLIRTKNLKKALELGEHLLKSEFHLLKVDDDAFNLGWELFQKANMSFTDCSSLALMRLYGIDKIATFDTGFGRVKGVKILK